MQAARWLSLPHALAEVHEVEMLNRNDQGR